MIEKSVLPLILIGQHSNLNDACFLMRGTRVISYLKEMKSRTWSLLKIISFPLCIYCSCRSVWKSACLNFNSLRCFPEFWNLNSSPKHRTKIIFYVIRLNAFSLHFAPSDWTFRFPELTNGHWIIRLYTNFNIKEKKFHLIYYSGTQLCVLLFQ